MGKAIAEEGMPGIEDVKEAFVSLDSNGDGFIDAGEAIQLFAECCPSEVSEAELTTVFECMDINRDGRIDILEFSNYFCRVWTSKFTARRAAVAASDDTSTPAEER